MTNKTLEQRVKELHFDLDVLVRYYCQRVAFVNMLQAVHASSIFIAVLLIVGFSGYSNFVGVIAVSFILLMIHAAYFVFGNDDYWLFRGLAGLAYFYDRLKREACDIEIALIQSGTTISEKEYALLHAEKERLEMEDVRKYGAVLAMATNTAHCARGNPESFQLTWWQRTTANIRRMPGVSFSQVSSAELSI